MRAVVVLLCALLIAGVASQAAPATTTLNSTTANDSPSWVTHIQKAWGMNEFFVFGETTLRTINSGNDTSSFYANPVTDPWNFPLIDLHTFFVNSTTQYTFATPYVPMFTAVSKVGSPIASTQSIQQPFEAGLFDFNGFLSYALRVDFSNFSSNDIVTYFAGFVVTGPDAVEFGLTKTHYDPTPNQFDPRNQNFYYNPSDYWTIYSNGFTSFSNIFRPWVHYLPYWGPLNHTLVIVVDPNTRGVYGIDVNVNGSTPTQFTFGAGYIGAELVSTTFDGSSGRLVVGLSASGISLSNEEKREKKGDKERGEERRRGEEKAYKNELTSRNSHLVQLPSSNSHSLLTWFPTPDRDTSTYRNYSNPKALTMDSQFLYIGFNGYSEVVQFSLSNNSIVGYQRLPEYLHRSWDATSTPGHVYFVTYEQNAKVYRVAKEDFCHVSCPYNGYCTKGKCVCSLGYALSSDKTMCYLQAAREIIVIKHHYETAHGGEVALGILFALSFVAAAAGWFMWYRNRNHSYSTINR